MKKLSLENLFKLLLVLTGVLFSIFAGTVINSNVNEQKAAKPTITHTEQQNKLETYTYKITKIDSTGYYGKSTTDQTGIYFINDNVPKGTELNEGDKIKVSFPNNSYEKITNIEKIN